MIVTSLQSSLSDPLPSAVDVGEREVGAARAVQGQFPQQFLRQGGVAAGAAGADVGVVAVGVTALSAGVKRRFFGGRAC